MEESELLTICSVCEKIKIAEDMWLGRDINNKLYNRFMEKYEGRLSHGYCPSCFENASKEVEEFMANRSLP